jgi:hypothetical protein
MLDATYAKLSTQKDDEGRIGCVTTCVACWGFTNLRGVYGCEEGAIPGVAGRGARPPHHVLHARSDICKTLDAKG